MQKYIFKYPTKGFDCARTKIHSNFVSANSSSETVNKIENYLEYRYITPEPLDAKKIDFLISVARS